MSKLKRLRPLPAGAPAGSDGSTTTALEISDEQIIFSLRQGEAWAAEVLYDRVSYVVERTLRRILQSADADYEDLLQVTLERVVESLVQQRFSGACSLTTWASAIAGHVGVDALRSRIRERALFRRAEDVATPVQAYPQHAMLEKQLEARSEIEHLHDILGSMKPEQADAVVMHDALGHEIAEIAALAGVTVAAAQSRLVRGRKELLRRARARFKRGHD
ncbi:MAG TPA: RNA polymerase sigma factor [Polyangiaceae bacterium]|jgi:RNA polymerase sigma-70 factor (ECF subfamily)|nr:RNA polymerase sigma factor [Polyangiaceae bacterium]